MAVQPRFLPLGDSGVTVQFGEGIDPEINDQVLAFAHVLEESQPQGVIEVVPTYHSATVYFDPLVVNLESLTQELRRLAHSSPVRTRRPLKMLTIPVLYGGDAGPDLPSIARTAGLSPEDVVALHRSVDYRVYMLGFSPGFPYLGTVPQRIAAPRLAEPRLRVPAGSVGIAGSQTGIYPQESPGGWRLIGRTPLQLYDPKRPIPFLLGAGDRVRFTSIGQQEFDRLARDM